MSTLAVVLATPPCLAGSLLWNVGSLELHETSPVVSSNSKTYSFSISGFETGTSQHPDIWIQTLLVFDCGIGYRPDHQEGSFIAAMDDSESPDGDWARIGDGDAVGFDSTRGAETSFFRDYSGERQFGEPIFVPYEGYQSLFLAFALANANPAASDSGGIPDTIYGWVEFKVDLLDVSMIRSAIDLSGKPLSAGQVPEPSAAILGLIGIGMLIRRRKA